MTKLNWQDFVYEAVKKIPKGKVSNYGTISKTVNSLSQSLRITPRMVGWTLHNNPDPENIPCHRVVDRNGKLAKNYAFGGWREQKRKLLAEGVRFKDKTHVDFFKDGA